MFRIIVAILIIYFSSATANVDCDKLGILLYEDMDCKPHYAGNNLCPTKYDCKGLLKSNSTCYYKGKAFKLNEEVSSDFTAPTCDLGCFCSHKKKQIHFKCAALDCPEWGTSYPKDGCYRKYSLDACCSVRETCPPFDNSTKCVFEGREYKEGENFLPKNSCHRCVCQPGFAGKIEAPFCRRRACNVQIKHQWKIQQNCAPVYFQRQYRTNEMLCCPNTWICADGSEKIEGKPISGGVCRFGNRTLKVGEGFSKTVKQVKSMKINCECKVPPLLTCLTDII